jgi:allantoinase
VVDMPLNSIPPTTTVENFEIKRQAAKGQCWTDVAFWGGVIPGNQVPEYFCFQKNAPLKRVL